MRKGCGINRKYRFSHQSKTGSCAFILLTEKHILICYSVVLPVDSGERSFREKKLELRDGSLNCDITKLIADYL